MKHIAVYLGSRMPNNANLKYAAKAFGKALAQENYGLVYGGSKTGLMGLLATSALEHDGIVTGIIPDVILRQEFLLHGLTHTFEVETMHDRKALIIEKSDAFVAFPGGCGTMDEIFEAITWAQIGLHQKPTIFLNLDRFYDGIKVYIETATNEGVIMPQHASQIYFPESIKETMELLERLVKCDSY